MSLNPKDYPTYDNGDILRAYINSNGMIIAEISVAYFGKDATPEMKAFVSVVEKFVASVGRRLKAT